MVIKVSQILPVSLLAMSVLASTAQAQTSQPNPAGNININSSNLNVLGGSIIQTQVPQPNPANVLDWEQIAQDGQWVSGQRSGSFQVGGGTIDVNFDLGGTSQFVGFGGGTITPDINDVVNGSAGADDRTLHLQIDSDTVNPENNFIKMVTTFNDFGGPLSDVSFNLFDIDIKGNKSWQDRVTVKGFLNGEEINPIFDILDGTTVVQRHANTLEGLTESDNDGDNGNVGVSFAGSIDRFELFFTDGLMTSPSNPNSHGISIGDISFGSVEAKDTPEPSILFSLGLLAVAGLVSKRKLVQS